MVATFQVLFITNAVLIALHGVVVLVLYHSTMKYVKSFGNMQDPYTIGTLVLLGLSTFSLFLNLPWMILNSIDDPAVDAWRSSHQNGMLCSMKSSTIFSKALFTLAIAANSTRWALLIVSVKFISY